MGTPYLSVPFLDAIIKSNRDVIYVVTQTDKPMGRGQRLVVSPVKDYAVSRGIPVLQPEKLSDAHFSGVIRDALPDYIIVVAYGRIIPPEILQIPRKYPVNVHASLLPEYRGASPIQWAILNGRSHTGVTTMLMSAELDAGDILLQDRIEIERTDTTGSLSRKISDTGTELLIRTLDGLDVGTIVPIPQQHERATYAPLIKKEDGLIDWKDSAENLYNRIRAFDPWPGTYTYYNNKRLVVWKAELTVTGLSSRISGEIVGVESDGISVSTGAGGLKITEIQAEGKKRMRIADFLRGQQVEKGVILTGI